MKIAVYPGSFNPWHSGHTDVLFKALKIFDEVIVAKGWNPDKPETAKDIEAPFNLSSSATIKYYDGLLRDFIESLPEKPCAIIKGIRNYQDLEYEKTQQYWNEDLGIDIPVVYFITDRNLSHISSSAIRALEKVKK